MSDWKVAQEISQLRFVPNYDGSSIAGERVHRHPSAADALRSGPVLSLGIAARFGGCAVDGAALSSAPASERCCRRSRTA
jgi:hypothetical protein